MPPLQLRQEFPTLKAFKEALHAWAIEAHFEPRILKSDTGRVRVGCKRDPNCPFVIRCNWERKGGREPLARVTVLRERHTCLNGLEWRPGGGLGGEGQGQGIPGMVMGTSGMGGLSGMDGGGGMNGIGGGGGGGQAQQQQQQQQQQQHQPQPQHHQQQLPGLEIRQDADGNIIPGARVLGPMSPRLVQMQDPNTPTLIPVLPKVQRNSASRLPFLMEILPRLMRIDKDTTPVEIRECLLREYGAEVHLQQCRRAKTEILKKRAENGEAPDGEVSVGGGGGVGGDGGDGQGMGGSADGIGSQDGDSNNLFEQPGIHGTPTPAPNQPPHGSSHGAGLNGGANVGGMGAGGAGGVSDHGYELHTASGIVIPQVPRRAEVALSAVSEPAVRCPFCINHRWMRSVKDAVEHMSMHVVVS
ncbi:uncharacterized protein L3040_002214 [Drepanopeziza brunnea f. sp. 'multigermtubi']|uniref:Transposase MuDR plant domain-containing protein n=1 Tax=Marssonina brunnea f. sp. multigermtubi (strain MB_m1) TaxID=1072389 RepID=K1X4M5_MARBU|nr:uncharacterized protein MBM_02063 [Drepanopeziza brunnea f. sp. 'multigermtubi' MB_m1]EKD20111.1 hypothetical protein MBM_02063 [Drepanopeziza brunnea f. sp. 'multigermtubi' MB_m1]KAJ5050331.1 hypothetical protein L3040_002214 [Drepanopeziza brunnea f. sp. 'multigermtubi']